MRKQTLLHVIGRCSRVILRQTPCTVRAGILVLLILQVPAYGTEPPRVNILCIVADDLGWADVGYHGSPIKTPNIDRLREGGVELDQFCGAAVARRGGL